MMSYVMRLFWCWFASGLAMESERASRVLHGMLLVGGQAGEAEHVGGRPGYLHGSWVRWDEVDSVAAWTIDGVGSSTIVQKDGASEQVSWWRISGRANCACL